MVHGEEHKRLPHGCLGTVNAAFFRDRMFKCAFGFGSEQSAELFAPERFSPLVAWWARPLIKHLADPNPSQRRATAALLSEMHYCADPDDPAQAKPKFLAHAAVRPLQPCADDGALFARPALHMHCAQRCPSSCDCGVKCLKGAVLVALLTPISPPEQG